MARHVQIKQYVDGSERTTVVDLDRLTPENSRILAALPLEDRPAAAARLASASAPSATSSISTMISPPSVTSGAVGVQELWEAIQRLQTQVAATASQSSTSVESGWESLRLPFLKPHPEKPRQRVIFRREGMGVLTSRYHGVFFRGMMISLVFDTRYEDAEPFIPDATKEGELLEVTVPGETDDGSSASRSFRVRVYDLHQSIGCLDIVNLIIVEEV